MKSIFLDIGDVPIIEVFINVFVAKRQAKPLRVEPTMNPLTFNIEGNGNTTRHLLCELLTEKDALKYYLKECDRRIIENNSRVKEIRIRENHTQAKAIIKAAKIAAITTIMATAMYIAGNIYIQKYIVVPAETICTSSVDVYGRTKRAMLTATTVIRRFVESLFSTFGLAN